MNHGDRKESDAAPVANGRAGGGSGNKSVWVLNHYAMEPSGAGGTRHYSLARHLGQNGWDAELFASSIEYNTGRQRLKEGEEYKREVIEGVPFTWVMCPPYQGNGAGRMRNMLTFSWKMLRADAVRVLPEPDIVIGSSVHPFAAWAGALLAKRYRVPFVFEVRDLWPQTLVDMGTLSDKGLTTRLLRMLEKWLYRKASRIVVLLPEAHRYICPLGIPAEKIAWIPNGVELDDYPPPPAKKEAEKFTLMYFGAHGGANGLDNLLDAMKLLKDEPVELRLIGDGPAKEGLLEKAREEDIANVSFEDPVPKSAIRALASEADIFLFNLIDAPVFNFGISSNKLFDFMAAARPIVFCCDSSNNPVAEAEAGITVPPSDLEALAEAVKSLVAMTPEGRRELGQRGREYVEKMHAFSNLAAKLSSVLDEVEAEHAK